MPLSLPGARPNDARWEAKVSRAYRAPKRTILCIDDDNAILRYERSLLESSGYMVLTSASAQQGLRLALMSQLDAVVLDYHMPEMNGHEVAAAIKKRRPEILIVMLSGSEIPEETLRLADAVVPKADAIRRLLPTVTQLCNRSLPS
jgi:two-component system, OmpR family, response regulator CpxR